MAPFALRSAYTLPARLSKKYFGSTESFGVVHDGITDQTDRLDALFSEIGSQGGGTLQWSKGLVICKRPIALPDNLRLVGENETSSLRNISERGHPSLQAPFRIGHWHPAHNGVRAKGSTSSFKRLIKLLPAEGPITPLQHRVKLRRPQDAAYLPTGSIAYIRSRASIIQSSTGHDIEIPVGNSLARVIHSDAANGWLEFEHPMGLSLDEALLGAIPLGTRDAFDFVRVAQNIIVEGVRAYGRNAVGGNSTGAYNCHFRDIGGDVHHVVQTNGFAHCTIKGFRGTFVHRIAELKFCSHDSTIDGIHATQSSAHSGPGGLFSIGEYCRNLLVSDFSISAPRWNGSQLFQLQPGTACSFAKGSVFARSCVTNPIHLYVDRGAPLTGCRITNVFMSHASRVSIVVQGGSEFEPIQNSVDGCTFESTWPKHDQLAAVINSATGNCIKGNVFPTDKIQLRGRAGDLSQLDTSDSPC